MQKILFYLIFTVLAVSTTAQCLTNVDFTNWQKGGQPGNGDWVVQNGGSQVHQTVNGDPTFFYSPFDLMNVHVTGSFKSTDNDDDWMGFVFSYQNPLGAIDSFDCWLFDWKQHQQNGASSGKSLDRVLGVIPPSQYTNQFWNHTNSAQFTVVQNTFGGAGWVQGFNHSFELYLTYTRATIYIDGVLTFDHPDCYQPGRFGFYNYSQKDCYYSNFQYDLYVDYAFPPKVCLGAPAAFQFTNVCVTSLLNQYQSMTWDFGDGTPPQVINNPTLATANVNHTYAAAGTYTASLTVLDNNGCSVTKTHSVDVRTPIVLSPTLTPPPCNGGSNGSITVAATGGFGGYSYSWNGGANVGPTYAGITAGTYTVTATDGFCATSGQYTLNQPTALTATTTHTDASCGLNNGSATIVISGGTAPYAGVTWAGQSGSTVTGLGPGTYIADFHDANACSALLQYTATIGSSPCGLTSNTAVTNVTCYGGNDGTATLTVTGGIAPVTITWSNGASGATATGLIAGAYTYNYSDAVPAHAFSGTVTINQPGAAMVAQATTVAITCAGSNDGQALASVVSGGTAPYTYTWSNGQTGSPSITGLGPGPVTVTIADNSGCTATATGTVSGVPSLATTFVTVMDSCFHDGNGSALVRVTGGSPPFTYAWNNLFNDTANLHLIAGTYTVTVTDHSNCSVTGTATVPGPPTGVNRTFTDVYIACHGAATGNFNITPSGGVPPYTYTWNPGTVSGNNPTGLVAGIYNFTVSDSYGCTAIGTDTLTEPATALSATSSHTNISCSGGSDGTIMLALSGGTLPYTYQGTPIPPGNDTLRGLAAGTYAGNVIDSAGCTVALSETITQPGAQSATVTGTNNICFGATQGTASANFVNATGSVIYNWTGGLTGQNISGLVANTYTVTATDQNSCTVTGSYTVTAPAAVVMTVTPTDATCFGANGSATATPSGGTTPFTYEWSNGGSGQTIALPAGNYTVTSTDASTCQQTGALAINQPTQITIQEQHVDVKCFGDNTGSITLTVTGGTGNVYQYVWNPNVSTTNTANALTAATSSVSVTDQANCERDTFITVAQPAAALSDVVQSHDISCFGANDGTIIITTSGGTVPYAYTWSPSGGPGNASTGLSASAYSITVTDFNSCSLTETATINEPAQIVLTPTQTDLVCYHISTGVASVTVAGGTMPYTYTWTNNVSNSNTASSLAAGQYTVTVTDLSSCIATNLFTINEQPQLILSETHINNLCFGTSTGSITITATGGTPGYTYQWNPNVSSAKVAANIAAGPYTVTVTDTNACTVSQSVTITEPTVLNLNAIGTDALCFGQNSGTITASATGGVTPYAFAITPDGVNFQNSPNGQFNNLASANYGVLVADANACTDSGAVFVNQPAVVANIVTPTDITCYHYTNGQVVITTTGGTPVYNYAFSTGAQNTSGIFSGLSTGSYTVTIADAHNCISTDSATVTEPDSVLISILPDPITVKLGENVELQTNTNQTGALTYTWQPAFGLSCYDCQAPVFSGNYSAVYNVVVVNAQGCTGSYQVDVTVTPNYDIFIPNVFTPNGDGINDEWKIFGNIPGLKQIDVKVFNRIGEKVFESNDINFTWDGRYKGALVPVGVYVYEANFVWLNNHSDNTRSGSITILE